jgi:NAD-dependent DNA ligase
MERLRNATAEEICAIDGVGPKLAETLVEFFAKLKRRGQPEPVDPDKLPDEVVGAEVAVADSPIAAPIEGEEMPVMEAELGTVHYQMKPRP